MVNANITVKYFYHVYVHVDQLPLTTRPSGLYVNLPVENLNNSNKNKQTKKIGKRITKPSWPCCFLECQ